MHPVKGAIAHIIVTLNTPGISGGTQDPSFSYLETSFFLYDPVYFLTSLAFGSYNYSNAGMELMLGQQGYIIFLNEIIEDKWPN